MGPVLQSTQPGARKKKSPAIRQEHRPEEQTFFTLPEWYIVYSADEYAAFLNAKRPSQFPYFSSISQFWKVRRGAIQRTEGKYPSNSGYEMMIWVIGLSFSFENFLKGVYESSVGRATEAIASWPDRQPPFTGEERFMQRIAQDYARFVRDRPWYEFPFLEKLGELWDLERSSSESWIRAKERKFYGLLELGAKTIYAWLIQKGTASAYEPEDFFLVAKVSGFSPGAPDLEKLQVELIHDDRKGQQTLIVPRYESFTKAIPSLVKRGVRFQEIAGNRLIAFTAISSRDWKPDPADGEVFLEWDILTDSSRKRVAIAVQVNKLHQTLIRLETQGVHLDHIYDY